MGVEKIILRTQRKVTMGSKSDFDKTEHKHSLQSRIEVRQVKRGTILQKRGDTRLNGFVVKEGLLRSYTIDEKGKEHIFMFGPEGWTIGDVIAIVKSKPTELYVDAVEDSVIEVASIELQQKFIDNLLMEDVRLEFKRLITRIGVLQNRIIMLMSATALERYQDFVGTYPEIVQRVPQKMIASYLGITPEALSKLKSELVKPKK